jgi:hypothetical protein
MCNAKYLGLLTHEEQRRANKKKKKFVDPTSGTLPLTRWRRVQVEESPMDAIKAICLFQRLS